jgi:hypothetical protein
MRRKSSRRRRSATQWAQLLAGWDRDTTSAADFAKSLGVARGTLAWWCWRLKHTPVSTAAVDDTVRFLQVDVAHEAGSLDARGDWEFTCAAGHTLRVRGGVDPEQLRLVLDHMTARRV